MELRLRYVMVDTHDETPYDKALVWGTLGGVEVWAPSPDGPLLVAKGPPVTGQAHAPPNALLSNGRKAQWALTLEDGQVWLGRAASGCQCGWALKKFNPTQASA